MKMRERKDDWSVTSKFCTVVTTSGEEVDLTWVFWGMVLTVIAVATLVVVVL